MVPSGNTTALRMTPRGTVASAKRLVSCEIRNGTPRAESVNRTRNKADESMMKTRIATLSLILAAGSFGCARAATVKIQNPFVSGAVAQNEIQYPDRATEMKYSLPTGTLVDEASLLSLDDKQVCFKVTLRTEEKRKDL